MHEIVHPAVPACFAAYRVCSVARRCLQAEKILREAPAGTKIYVPIRNAPRMSFADRFWKKVPRISTRTWPYKSSLGSVFRRMDSIPPCQDLEGYQGVKAILCGPHEAPLRAQSSSCSMYVFKITAAAHRQVLPRDFFNLLRELKGAGFEGFIREHMIPFEADMDKPMLGIAPDMLDELYEQVHDALLSDSSPAIASKFLIGNDVVHSGNLAVGVTCPQLGIRMNITRAYHASRSRWSSTARQIRVSMCRSTRSWPPTPSASLSCSRLRPAASASRCAWRTKLAEMGRVVMNFRLHAIARCRDGHAAAASEIQTCARGHATAAHYLQRFHGCCRGWKSVTSWSPVARKDGRCSRMYRHLTL